MSRLEAESFVGRCWKKPCSFLSPQKPQLYSQVESKACYPGIHPLVRQGKDQTQRKRVTLDESI